MDSEPRLFIPRVHNSLNCSSTPRVFSYYSPLTKKTIKFIAERGLVHIIDEDDGSYKTCSRKSFLHRARAINDAIPKTTDAACKREAQRLVARMLAVIHAAGDQGDPFEILKPELDQSTTPTKLSPLDIDHLSSGDPLKDCGEVSEE